MVADDWSLLCREWSGHTTLGRNDELAFALFVFFSFYFALTFVSHDGTVSAAERKKRGDQMFSSRRQGVNIRDHE